MHLFLPVLYSVKACKIIIYVVQFVVRNMSFLVLDGWTYYGILVPLSNPSIIAVCVFFT
jgi:hypothetical protein